VGHAKKKEKQMHRNTDEIINRIFEDNARRRAAPRKTPTPEDPTPNWRTHGEFPDDRRHWLMCPSTERYSCAAVTAIRHTCRCGIKHDAAVYADGTMFCEQTNQFIVATAETPDLKTMRATYEDDFIAMVRATELH
jgi:hypothetical protein